MAFASKGEKERLNFLEKVGLDLDFFMQKH